MWVVPTHFFLKTYVIAILSQGWGLFSEGETMKSFNLFLIHTKRQSPYDYQLKPQTPQ